MTVRNKGLFTALILLLFVTLLAGCSCKHTWQESTCLAPRTCTRCGETEGKVRAHDWGSTDCANPQPCVVCGTMEGLEVTHQWREDCKICVSCGQDERPADDRFPDRLAEGLQKRFRLEKELKVDRKYVYTKEDWTAMFDAEYEKLASFKEDKFKDETLRELAYSYVRHLEESYETLELFGTDQWTDAYNSRVYQQQTVTLVELNKLFPITVAEEYEKNLTKMLNNGEIIQMVTTIIDQIYFLDIRTTGFGTTYETTIRNSTSLTFEWFTLEVELLDENGEVLDTKLLELANWEPDEKVRLNFVTKEPFSSIDIAFANWKLPE